MRPTWLGGALVLGAAALWGSLGLFARVLYDVGASPLELATVRASIGFLGLAVWMLRRPERLRIRPRDLPFFALYGAVSIALFQFLYFATLERTSLSIAAALLYTAPAFVVLIARIWGGEPLTRARLGALALVLAGCFLVTGALRLIATEEAGVSAAALGFGLASGLTYGLYTIFGKHALRRYDPAQTVFFAFAFGALFMAFAEPPWRAFLAFPQATPIFLMLGLVPTLAAYLLYLFGLKRLPAGTASMLATAEPVVATLLGVILLAEPMGLDQALGIALIVGAALVLASQAEAGAEA